MRQLEFKSRMGGGETWKCIGHVACSSNSRVEAEPSLLDRTSLSLA
jgi:hypothetical protein